MSTYGHGEGWSSLLVLTPLPPPPPDRIVQPGAQLVTATAIDASPPHSHPALLIAWAQLPDGDWASLMVWDGFRRDARGHDRASARWSWVTYDLRRVAWSKPWPDQPNGLRWFGRTHGSPMEAAFLEAVESLPAAMRQAASAHVPEVGPPE